MRREEVKDLLPIIKAFGEGKTIQMKWEDKWEDMDLKNPSFDSGPSEYRIKPETEYRPYDPEGLDLSSFLGKKIKHKVTGNLHMIVDLTTEGIFLHHNHYVSWEILFKEYVYLDGTPCGTKY